jgi:hypothetical protein
VRGRLVIEADFNRYLTGTKDWIANDGFNAAGEVRLAKNIAAWLAVGGLDPKIDCYKSHCCDASSDDSSDD